MCVTRVKTLALYGSCGIISHVKVVREGGIMFEPNEPIEPIPLQDIFCMGVAKVEIIGPCARFFMYADQATFRSDVIERVIVAKFVVPLEAIPECIRKAVEATAGHAIGQLSGLVKTALHLQ